ncbi:hypothetical protein DRP77_06585 [Candidatus Poribacteria bacterium]|nr:MAG: hypothetical protein DRP77_06585 [Candidatus Poribacteria bacterium]
MSCEERIDEMLRERVGEFEEALESEDPVEWLDENALALTRLEVYRLELSWGGPQDYFEFFYDPEAEALVDIAYHYLDWFDGAVRRVKPGTREWEVLERLFYSAILIE